MWNKLALKSRPVYTNHFCLLRRRSFYTQSAINFTLRCNINQRLSNKSTYQRLITLLPKQFCSATTSTSLSSIASPTTHQPNITKDKDGDNKKLIIDEQMLDKLYEEMDQRIAEVNQFNQSNQSNGKSRQFKVYGLTFVTVVAGVIAGAYAAHVGAWFLDKLGIFMFQEEDDD